ncbi:DUF2478 domain-containing protein [Actibacterium lipolyticum]|uniref:3-dehydroquinate dehydratase n=1 Tax=Actibacterium lipolyticum TaxID=1524263 RepID=A0A238KNG4_9RHOB|nr:DUF2478 domain-containing protein [Actibacterium lipolyticum]SMX44373.1 hypothetical protein COL8621_02540 [Actibacterium lipolyticum]
MLGYVTTQGRGASDRLLFDAAVALRAEGLRVAGAVQENVERDPTRSCDMDLHVLTNDSVVRISQNLGRGSRGCRLDPEGLEQAVGLVGAALDGPIDLLIINKFGKQELEGRGFRPLIGQALAQGVPVLTSVGEGKRDGFAAYADGMAEQIEADLPAVLAWCRQAAAATA